MPDFRAVQSASELVKFISRIKNKVAVDTETNGPNPAICQLVGISLSVQHGEAIYIPLRHCGEDKPKQIPIAMVRELLGPILANPKIRKIGHNFGWDVLVLEREDFDVANWDDTKLGGYLLDPDNHHNHLDDLGAKYLGWGKAGSFKELCGRGKKQITFDKVPLDKAIPYAANDAALTLELWSALESRITAAELYPIYSTLELPLQRVLYGMQHAGVLIDTARLKALEADLAPRIEASRKKVWELAGQEFLISSPKQLGDILYKKLKLPSVKVTPTNQACTDKDTLEELKDQHPIIPPLLEFRHLSKLVSTYVSKLPTLIYPETGRVHGFFNQTTTATGRLSSSNPNLQNIPARDEMGQEIRRSFIAPPGHLLCVADYSQIELRVLAHLSGDERLIQQFKEGKDAHQETADAVFQGKLDPAEARFKAKIINFSVIYGTSAYSLAKLLGTSTQEAQWFINRYFRRYPRVQEYLNEVCEEGQYAGFVQTILGRKRPMPELRSHVKSVYSYGRRVAMNMPIQGSAADIMKAAMLQVSWALQDRQLKSRLLLQVHDELVIEVPENEKEKMEKRVTFYMEHFPDDGPWPQLKVLRVPMKVKIGWGTNWADAKE